MSAVTQKALLDSLLPEQRDELIEILDAERAHAVGWWTYLNEMRCCSELPDWIKKQLVGSHPDLCRFEEAQVLVNTALFGVSKVVAPSRRQPAHFFSKGELASPRGSVLPGGAK